MEDLIKVADNEFPHLTLNSEYLEYRVKRKKQKMDYYEKDKERMSKLRSAAFRELMKWEKKDLVQLIIDQSDEETLEEWLMGHRHF